MKKQEISIIVKAVDKFTKTFSKINSWVSEMTDKIKKNQATFQKMAGFWTVAFAWLWLWIKSLTDNASNLLKLIKNFELYIHKWVKKQQRQQQI